MRKKFTMLLTALLAFVGVAKADVTDLPTLTEDTSNPTWYTIKNTRSGKFVTYNSDDKKMSQQSAAVAASFFYFTAGEGEAADGFTAIKIHNFATTNLMADFEKWDATGATWYLHVDATNGNTPKGFHFTNAANLTGWNAWNDHGQSEIGSYYSNDAGGVFEISAVTDFSAVIDIDAAKATAINELNNLATVPVLYPTAVANAVKAINDVTPASNGLKDLNDAVEAINAIVVNYRNAAYQALDGKYFTIQTLATDRSQGFMKMDATKVVGTADASNPANIWQFVYNNNGAVNIYNPYTGKYLCEPQGNSVDVAVTTDKANAGAYVLNVNATPTVADAKVKFTSNTKSVHMAGGHTLVRWDDGAASEWQVVEVTDFSALINSYKTASTTTLDSWATLSVVFDAALINAAKTAINGIVTTNWETFAAIDAELKKVTDAVAAKMFTFQTIATDNGRENVWISANASTMKAFGAAKDAQDYNAVWSLQHAGASSFYLYNELNKVYLGAPVNNTDAVVLTETPAAAYTLEMIADKGNNVVELHSNGGTLHASNHGDKKLISWDGDQDASRWMVNVIDVTKDITDLLATIENDDYAEVPALGQYPKESYDALVAAQSTAKTVEEVDAAIAAFKKSKNMPVFTIDGAGKDYAIGNSVYDDGEDAPAFKTTDIYDKTMWWALDQVKTTVSATGDNYVSIYNVGTGNGFWGQSSIKIAATSDAKEGVFLFYTPASSSTAHFQQSGSTIVYYNSTGSDTGSAAKFTYIGNTYDLNKLTYDHLKAAEDLKVVYGKYASYEDDEFVYNATPALGEYAVSATDFKDALTAVKQFANASVSELANADVEAMNEAAETLAAKADELFGSKNVPVYIITSAWDAGYSAGAAIYYDGAWKWKKANKYDKQMWMTLPGYTEEDVPAAVDAYDANNPSYGFCDYLTRTKMRDKDVQLVKITGWEGAYSLQYNADANSTDAAQHAQSGGALVNWKPALLDDRQASAWKVEYVGNTYDLDQLEDEQLEALTGLQNAFDSKVYLFDAVVGDGIGQYKDNNGTLSTMLQDLFDMTPILNESLSNLNDLKMTIEEINATAAKFNSFTVEANMPEEGKYYRIYGANSNVSPAGQYITGHTNADGGRIALTAEADASTIYYYKDGHLQAYQSGKYIALSGTYYTFDAPAIDDKEAVEASAIEFAASSYIAGAYTIKSADRYLHYKVYNGAVEVDRCQSEESADDSWYLVEVEKQTITYIYKDGETELARQEVTEFAGMRYPAADATLPLGYTAAALEGNIAVGETEKVIACTFDAAAIPFNYYESFADVEQWYYLNFTAAKNYLYYADDNTVLDATKTEIDRSNREAYAWAFIGTPTTGFQVVNKLAGNAKGLKALESGAAVGEGAHTFKVTASDFIADAKGFFMAATNGESADRFNKQDNKVVYWSGADAGSTFTVIECPFGAVAELEALIVAAEALKATVGANTGDKIGEFSEETASVLADAITNAKSKGDAATAEDVAALQAVIDGTKIILPTAGKYYQFHSAVAFADTKAVYSDESKALWKTLNDDDKVFYWEAVENEGGIALKNAKDGKFLNGNAGQSGAWSVSDTPANIDVIIITKEDNEKGYQYGLVLNNWQMHANGHGEGSGTASNIVSWNNTEVGKASAWYIKEVELPEFCDIVYEFKHEGVTIDKFTQRAELKAGAEFPEIAISLPYGVSTNATKPDGTVTTSQTFEFTLNIDKALPFETAADANNITTWYYVQMHANPNVTAYIEDAGNDNVAWNNKSVDDAEIESHLWGFVGDVWTGVKVINKSGRAIVSTSGAAVLGAAENATAFIPTVSNGVLSDWFCLKYPESNYLNAQGDQSKGEGIVSSYNETDNGSSFFVTEADKEFSVTVNDEAGYSTYYSNYRLAIPRTVEAYIIDKVDGKSINLKQVEGVLPANTGIILKNAGTHTFVTSAAQTADVYGNLLKGTAVKTLITAEPNTNYYVLAMPEGEEVGLYKAALNKDANGNKVTEGGVAFHNGANKVYLPVTVEVAAEAPAMFSFTRGDETTDIEGSELDAQGAMLIYDLAGRRVEKMVKGIYIVNGKKVLVK